MDALTSDKIDAFLTMGTIGHQITCRDNAITGYAETRSPVQKRLKRVKVRIGTAKKDHRIVERTQMFDLIHLPSLPCTRLFE